LFPFVGEKMCSATQAGRRGNGRARRSDFEIIFLEKAREKDLRQVLGIFLRVTVPAT